MKKTWIRWGISTLIFIIALIFFSIYTNQGTTDMTVDMGKPDLPVAYVNIDGMRVNMMHGYLDRMDCSTIRDCITPIGEDRTLSFIIDKYETAVADINVEVRSVDGERLIENTRMLHFDDYKKSINASIQLKDLIEPYKEYNLILVLNLTDGRTVYYYTRIVLNENVQSASKLQFVYDFNRKTLSKDYIKELSAYMEPDSEADNTSLGTVNIHNSMNQLTWAQLPSPQVVKTPDVTIREIGDTMASIELSYLLSSKSDGNTIYYNVTEFYRIRKTDQRFYLLSFNRQMNEIFVMDKSSVDGDRIMLGIRSGIDEMLESDGGEIVAFVNEGRLYSYNTVENKLIRLFAFFDTAEDDERSRFRGSDIKILDVEENGNIYFIVYGYMNRGIHEGRVGVEVYYYDSLVNTVEEQAFIPYSKSAQILGCDMKKLSFLNAGGDLFLFLDGVIYKVIPSMMDKSVSTENVNEDMFYVSDTQQTIAWQDPTDESEGSYGRLNVMNLVNGELAFVEAKNGEYLRPIGFMNDDLIYGICHQEDIIENRLGDVIYPMNKVVIRSDSGEILKEYGEEGTYVTGGIIEANQITLKRAVKSEDTGLLLEIEDDHITSNAEIKEGKNVYVYHSDEEYEKRCDIKIKSEMDIKGMKLLTPKEVLYEGGRNIELPSKELKDRFFVYGDGEVVGIYDKAATAVESAYAIRGTVMDVYGNEIYRRGETVARNQIMAIGEAEVTENKDSLAVCLDAILSHKGVSRNTEYMLARGETAYQIMQDNLSDVYVLNLTGCNMDMMLYYVNQDIPVLAYMQDDTAMLITGFNEQNIVVMDPMQGTIYKIGRKDAREMFEENGNHFLTYAKKISNGE